MKAFTPKEIDEVLNGDCTCQNAEMIVLRWHQIACQLRQQLKDKNEQLENVKQILYPELYHQDSGPYFTGKLLRRKNNGKNTPRSPI